MLPFWRPRSESHRSRRKMGRGLWVGVASLAFREGPLEESQSRVFLNMGPRTGLFCPVLLGSSRRYTR